MTYVWRGRQYVVVAAGGHGDAGAATSDAVVAFSLPRATVNRRAAHGTGRSISRAGG